MALVSIILPNYNHGKYLNQRIDTILAQTFQDFELIILDDRSQDNSIDIINSYKGHPKISHILCNEVNSGSTFKQWEKGINASIGEYIWIAESDDWSDRMFLSSMVEVLDKNTKAALAFSQSHFIDENNTIIGSGLEGIDTMWKKSLTIPGEVALQQFVWHTQIVNASSVLFRKKHYKLINSRRYADFKFCGDWFFWILLLEQGDLVYEIKHLNYFRQHTNNVRSRNSNNAIEVLEQLEIYGYLQSKYQSIVQKNERQKFEERLKFRLYVKICQHLKGTKVTKLRTSIYKSIISFPNLVITLPSLFLENMIKKYRSK